MCSFNTSQWTNEDFVREYCADADTYFPDRARHLAIIQSFYRQFVAGPGTARRVLDLGCGDGIITAALHTVDSSLEATLVDGSSDMLEAARSRLTAFGKINLVLRNFEDLDKSDFEPDSFELVVSSMAIHHLTLAEKRRLFSGAHHWLSQGGHLLVLDAVLGTTSTIEEWYITLWEQWITGIPDESRRNSVAGIPRRYKCNSDNKPDTLLTQLRALQESGFHDVDCYYKYGVFAMFGGQKG